MCYKDFKYNVYSRISKVGKIIKLLCGFCLQLLYTGLKLCIVVKSSTGIVCYCAVCFIYLRAGCYVCYFSDIRIGLMMT